MLSINSLNKVYSDGTHALRDINLQLPTGMIGLLGPNGAGKSTLMRTLACLQSADTGSVLLNGVDITKQPMKMRRQLGYLPQYFGVYPNMTCRALLQHMAILKGITDKYEQSQQIDNLLALTNLSEVADKKVTAFSGGMHQRFGIAQALLGSPNILIMDEPTTGLDPVERQRLHNMLVNISQNKLVLLSTHIVEDIENLCTYAAIMMRGEIVESDRVDALLSVPARNVWLTRNKPQNKRSILSMTHYMGICKYRVMSDVQPDSSAEKVNITLQDRYYLELAKQGYDNAFA